MNQSISETSEINPTADDYKVPLKRYEVKGIIHH